MKPKPKPKKSFGSWLKGAAGTLGNSIRHGNVLSQLVGVIPHPIGQVGSIGLRAFGLGKRQKGGSAGLHGRMYLI